VPVGDSPAPQPGETVKDQLMRTFSAVRTRLRASTHSEESASSEIATNGDTKGNGSHPDGTVGTMAGVDPLLAAQAASGEANGDDTAGSFEDVAVMEPAPAVLEEAESAAAADTIVDAPVETPVEAPPVEDAPLTEAVRLVALPLAEPLTAPPGGESSRPPEPAAPRPRRQRSRPALPILRRRPRVRKVTRIVRRVDAWGVFKISVIFYVILYIILLVAGVLLWNLANTTGTVANVEGFIRDLFGLKTFEFDGEKLFRASWVLGAILVVAGTGFNVTMAILFNLISDLMGGVRVTVLEEEVVLRERPVLPPPAVVDQPTEPSAEAGPVPPDESAAPSDPLVAERPPRRARPATPRRSPAKVSSRQSNGRDQSRAASRQTQSVPPTEPEGG
jgi:hypothetical protein